MALWTPDQLRRVREIVRRAHQGFAVALFGTQAAQDVAAELKRAGLVPEGAPDLSQDPYAYGQLLARLADPSLMNATPERILRELQDNPVEPLTPAERASVDMAAAHAGQYIVGLGDRVTARVMGGITGAESSMTPDAIREVVRDSTARNRLARETTAKLQSDLTDQVGDYARDWQRIATTEANNAIQEGTAHALEKKHDDPFVSKLPRPDACPACMGLYTDGGTPKVFKLSELRANGSNVGKKRAAWLPVIEAMHPWCACVLVRIPKGMAWDGNELVPEGEVEKSWRSMPDLRKAGPFIGPRGGRWADPKHTIPWRPTTGLLADPSVSDADYDEAMRLKTTTDAVVGQLRLTPRVREELGYLFEQRPFTHAEGFQSLHHKLATGPIKKPVDVTAAELAYLKAELRDSLDKVEGGGPGPARALAAALKDVISLISGAAPAPRRRAKPKPLTLEEARRKVAKASRAAWRAHHRGPEAAKRAKAKADAARAELRALMDLNKSPAGSPFKLAYRVMFQGLPISIENRKGSVRRWKDGDDEGETKLQFPYGYVRGTKGADGDEIDCYIGPNRAAPRVFVVHQQLEDDRGRWAHDEDKVFLGFHTEAAARRAYLAHVDEPRMLGGVSALGIEKFKRVLEAHKGKRLRLIQADPDGADLSKGAGGGRFLVGTVRRWKDGNVYKKVRPGEWRKLIDNKQISLFSGGPAVPAKHEDRKAVLTEAKRKDKRLLPMLTEHAIQPVKGQVPAGARMGQWKADPVDATRKWSHPEVGEGKGEAPWHADDWTPDLESYDHILINSSAGKDSQAMLSHMVKLADEKGVPREKLIVVHADLGRVEWDGTKELAEQQAKHYGLRFEVVKRQKNDLLEHIEGRHADLTQRANDAHAMAEAGLNVWADIADPSARPAILAAIGDAKGVGQYDGKTRARKIQQHAARQLKKKPSKKNPIPPQPGDPINYGAVIAWPSPGSRYCTSDHKRAVVRTLITGLHEKLRVESGDKKKTIRVLNTLGMRAQEGEGRANMQPFARDKEASTQRRDTDTWLPLHRWPEAKVWNEIQESGVPHHKAYTLGMRRLSCVFCIFASKEDLTIAAVHNPDLFEQYLELEAKLGASFKADLALEDVRASIAKNLGAGKKLDERGEWIEKAFIPLGLVRRVERALDLVRESGQKVAAIQLEWKPRGACVHVDTKDSSHHVDYLPYPYAFNASLIVAALAEKHGLPLEEHNAPSPMAEPAKLAKSALFLDDLEKGARHKYIRRYANPSAPPKFRYVYSVNSKHHVRNFQVGDKLELTQKGQRGHYEVTSRAGNWLEVRHDETGHTMRVSQKELYEIWHGQNRGKLSRAHDKLMALQVAAEGTRGGLASSRRMASLKQKKRIQKDIREFRARFGRDAAYPPTMSAESMLQVEQRFVERIGPAFEQLKADPNSGAGDELTAALETVRDDLHAVGRWIDATIPDQLHRDFSLRGRRGTVVWALHADAVDARHAVERYVARWGSMDPAMGQLSPSASTRKRTREYKKVMNQVYDIANKLNDQAIQVDKALAAVAKADALKSDAVVGRVNVTGVPVLVHEYKARNLTDAHVRENVSYIRDQIARIRRHGFAQAVDGLRIHLRFGPRARNRLDASSRTAGFYRYAPGHGGQSGNEEQQHEIMLQSQNARHVDGPKYDILIHEVGHRFYYKSLSTNARAAWKKAINERTHVISQREITMVTDIAYGFGKKADRPNPAYGKKGKRPDPPVRVTELPSWEGAKTFTGAQVEALPRGTTVVDRGIVYKRADDGWLPEHVDQSTKGAAREAAVERWQTARGGAVTSAQLADQPLSRPTGAPTKATEVDWPEVHRRIDKEHGKSKLNAAAHALANRIEYDIPHAEGAHVVLNHAEHKFKGKHVLEEHVTDYGAHNPSEAFAEAFAMYVKSGPRLLGPWTREFFRAVAAHGGTDLKRSSDASDELRKANRGHPIGTVRRWKDGNYYRKVRAGDWRLFRRVSQGSLPLKPAEKPIKTTADIYFASGSNHEGEILGFHSVGMDLGVAVNELTESAEAALLRLEGTGRAVFVDSGAFGEVKFNEKNRKGKLPRPKLPEGVPFTVEPITHDEWTKRLDTYERLASELGGQLYPVAPDKIADQGETLARLERYAPRVKRLQELGANVMTPLQKGPAHTLAEFDAKVSGILGSEKHIRAIPMAKDATKLPDILELLEARKGKIPAIHLLGIGAENAKLAPIVKAIRAVAPGITVTADSVRITALVGRQDKMRPLTAGQDRVRRKQLARAFSEGGTSDDYTDAIREPSGWMKDSDLKRMRTKLQAVGYDAKTLRGLGTKPDEWLQKPIHADEPGGPKRYEDPVVSTLLDIAWQRYLAGEFQTTAAGHTKLMGAGSHAERVERKRGAIEEHFGDAPPVPARPLAAVTASARAEVDKAADAGDAAALRSALDHQLELEYDHGHEVWQALHNGDLTREDYDRLHAEAFGMDHDRFKATYWGGPWDDDGAGSWDENRTTFTVHRRYKAPDTWTAPVEATELWRMHMPLRKALPMGGVRDVLEFGSLTGRTRHPQIVQGTDKTPRKTRQAQGAGYLDFLDLTPESREEAKRERKRRAEMRKRRVELDREALDAAFDVVARPHGQDAETASAQGFAPDTLRDSRKGAREGFEHKRDTLLAAAERRRGHGVYISTNPEPKREKP